MDSCYNCAFPRTFLQSQNLLLSFNYYNHFHSGLSSQLEYKSLEKKFQLHSDFKIHNNLNEGMISLTIVKNVLKYHQSLYHYFFHHIIFAFEKQKENTITLIKVSELQKYNCTMLLTRLYL